MDKMKTRYDKLIDLISIYEPRSIVEIGTWNGGNAIRMLQAAKQFHESPQYVGYDLFEEATAQTDAEEFNVKQHYFRDAVEAKIKKHCPWAEVNLIKGNTRDTLRSVTADFVFIDGGHSLETIAHDYEAVKHSGVIVFDDYYSPLPSGSMPDINKIGCNLIVANLPHSVIVSQDAVREDAGGKQIGYNGLAVVHGS